ncbi:tRNA lysidine(34) synthetase TilS [Chloroflexota bacterium]
MVKRQRYREPVEQRVLHFIRENNLVSERCRLLLAVSGGQDSVCLLHVLVKLQKELNIELHVAHLNHQLRGTESEADAQYVSQIASQFGVPVTVERRDVKAYQSRQRISLEEAAREVRYKFLAEVAKSIGAQRVAVGHTTDDQVETILMHLIRGTGTRGLRGLRPSSYWQSSGSGVTVIRPLLPVSRQETSAYCHEHHLLPRIDTSNFSLSPLRNKIRHQLLPLLKSYNPRVTEALLRTARITGDDIAFLDKESARLWGRVVQRQGETAVFNKEKFLNLPSVLQRYLLRAAIEKLSGNLKDIEARHIEEIMAVLHKPAGKRLSLPGGLIFAIEYDRFCLGPDAAALSPFPVLGNAFHLRIPGETSFSGWQVKATIIDSMEKAEFAEILDDGLTVCFDLGKVGDRVSVRCRQPSDRFQPLGMSQPKKLGEFMIDAKIPRAWRQRVPVVCSPQHILWVVGWRIDDRVKVTESTRQILRLEFKRVSGNRGRARSRSEQSV